LFCITPQFLLSFVLKEVKNKETLMISVYKKELNGKILVGNTDECSTLTFEKKLTVTYQFEALHEYIFELKNKKGEILGSGQCYLQELCNKKLTKELTLKLKEHQVGILEITATKKNPYISKEEKIKNTHKEVFLDVEIEGEGLKKMENRFSLSIDSADMNFLKVYESEIVKKTKNPKFKKFSIPLTKRLKNDEKLMKFDFYSGKNFIGRILGKYNRMMEIEKVTMYDKDSKANGVVKLNLFERTETILEMNYEYTYLDYVNSGLKFNVVFGIDFTNANTLPRQYYDLHEKKNEFNEYERVMHSFIEIMKHYHSTFEVLAFGGDDNEPFLNLSKSDSSTTDPIQMYQNYLKNVKLGSMRSKQLDPDSETVEVNGCNEFHHIIDHLIKENTVRDTYNILVLLIPNDFINVQKTIQKFIEASNNSPISIFIVGIGDSSFKTLRSINPDPKIQFERHIQFIYSEKMPFLNNLRIGNVKACREVFRFATLNSFKTSDLLAESLLSHIPKHVVKYMTTKGVSPSDVELDDLQGGYSMMTQMKGIGTNIGTKIRTKSKLNAQIK
jgi:hypothetical protein